MKPTDHSTIERKRVLQSITDICEDGTFSGYASLFGKIDLGRDKVEHGAFSRSLKQRETSGIRMLFQHDPSEPIGVWTDISEDEKGLFVKGRIVGQSTRGAEVLGLLRAGAIDGLSIGFKTQRSRTDAKSGIRTIIQADLWEISIVTFPMLPQARIDQVKSQTNQTGRAIPSVREFEHWLTRDAGFTRSQARTVIAKGFIHLNRKQDAAEHKQAVLADRIRQASRTMNLKKRKTIA